MLVSCCCKHLLLFVVVLVNAVFLMSFRVLSEKLEELSERDRQQKKRSISENW